MSWSSGSNMFGSIIEIMKDNVEDPEIRETMYTSLIDVFEDNDCDTLSECLGTDPAFDKVYNELYPEETDDLFEEDILLDGLE